MIPSHAGKLDNAIASQFFGQPREPETAKLRTLSPALAELKAGARAELARAEEEGRLRAIDAASSNWANLVFAAKEDLGPDLWALVEALPENGFCGHTTTHHFRLTVDGYRSIAVRYHVTSTLGVGNWTRATFPGQPADQVLEPDARALWRIDWPNGSCQYSHGLGFALHLAEKTEADIASEELEKDVPF